LYLSLCRFGSLRVVVEYVPRMADSRIEFLAESPSALFVTGARATGKTTTARRHASTVLRLDNPDEAAAVRADPDAALRDLEPPVLLDEWQAVPNVLGAVKRAVDTERVPGRFILSGSVRSAQDPSLWPGTGRLLPVSVHPMTEREQRGTLGPEFLELLRTGTGIEPAQDPPDLRGYMELALKGGFPEAVLEQGTERRGAWLDGYLNQMLNRDPSTLGASPDSVRLGRFFEAYALNTADLATDNTLNNAAGINHRTGTAYRQLLSDLGIIAELPSWHSNRLARLVKGRKRLVTDTGLWAAAVGVDIATVMSSGDLLGRLLETFVINQLRAETALMTRGPHLNHLRMADNRREVDLIADYGARGIVAIEIKASNAPNTSDARHLEWLRNQLGPRFAAGAVLHTGRNKYHLTDQIEAIPINALWS